MDNKEHKIGKVNLTFLATVLISVFASFVIAIICKGIELLIPGVGEKIYDVIFNDYFATLLVSQIILFLPSFIFILCNRKYFFSNLRIRKLNISTYGWIALFGLFFIPIISFVNSISLLFTTNVMASEVTQVVNSHSLISSLIVIAVIPCVLEETIYRGVFYNEYSRVNPLKAMLLSALLFGLLHMNLNQFMYAAVGGFVFAIMVEATGSITSSIIMHFMINGSSTLLSFYSSSITNQATTTTEELTTGQGVQGFSGILSFMNNLTAMQQAVVSLGIVASICVVFEIVIFNQILIGEGRKEYFKKIFKKKNIVEVVDFENDSANIVENIVENITTDSEGNIEGNIRKNDTDVEKNDIKLITPSLVIAMVLCVIIIIIRQIFKV